MIDEIARKWEQIDAQKTQLLARVAALEEGAQKTPASSRVWSPLQIVHHLILVEEEYLRFIAEGEKQGVSKKSPSRSPLIPFVSWMMRKRVSFPTLPSMEPSPQLKTLPELTREWDTVRGTFREKVKAANPNSPLALNPIMGTLTPMQITMLMEAHQGYHLQQIPTIEQ